MAALDDKGDATEDPCPVQPGLTSRASIRCRVLPPAGAGRSGFCKAEDVAKTLTSQGGEESFPPHQPGRHREQCDDRNDDCDGRPDGDVVGTRRKRRSPQ